MSRIGEDIIYKDTGPWCIELRTPTSDYTARMLHRAVTFRVVFYSANRTILQIAERLARADSLSRAIGMNI